MAFVVNPWSIRRMDRFVSEIAAAVGAPMHIILGAPLICNETTLASVDKGIHNKTTKYGLPTY